VESRPLDGHHPWHAPALEQLAVNAVACTTDQHELGESARWDGRRGELLRVDIMAGRVHRDRVDADGSLVPVRTYELPVTVGAIAPVEGDDGWLLAAERGFARLSPDGSLREELHVPAEQTTSCAFVGSRLYVTTATEDWTDEQRRADPAAGLTYRFDTDATGRPAAPFRPEPGWWATVNS
jgi:sugar lactone lactonase YvrE